MGAKRRAQRPGGAFANLSVAVLKKVQRRLERQLFAVHIEAEAGDRLVEEPCPGGAARDGLFVEELLEPRVELVRPILADVVEPGTIARQRAFGGEPVEESVREAVQLQREEQQMRRHRGDAILGIGHELGARRIGRVLGVEIAAHRRRPGPAPHRASRSARPPRRGGRHRRRPSARAARLPR